jgi:hypothetical protein
MSQESKLLREKILPRGTRPTRNLPITHSYSSLARVLFFQSKKVSHKHFFLVQQFLAWLPLAAESLITPLGSGFLARLLPFQVPNVCVPGFAFFLDLAAICTFLESYVLADG